MRKTLEAVLEVWSRARIPTQRIDSAERKLKNLHGEYVLLKKNKDRKSENNLMKVEMFKGDLEELFDLSHKDALNKMKNEEDKTFLLMQRESTLSCSMAGADKILSAQETRKRNRDSLIEVRRQRSILEMQEGQEAVPSTSRATSQSEHFSTSSSSISSDSDDNYRPRRPRDHSTSSKRRPAKNILTSNVVATLDRVNMSDRKAMFVLSAVSEACGQSLEESSMSRSTIRRTRLKTRKILTEKDKESFSSQDPLILHWDCKLLPDIVGGKMKVDRVAIIVTGGGTEKLLAIPQIGNGTGQEQAAACMRTLEDWGLQSQVRGLVFDTTASNTGLHQGACTLLEKSLNRSLVWIACRHHVMEIILSDVFTLTFGPSGAPDVGLFKRFQKEWPEMNKAAFTPGRKSLFKNCHLKKLQEEMLKYYSEALKIQQPRDDYRELVCLCQIFLGGADVEDVSFRSPGPIHHARWMAKAIYSLKIYLFQDQFELTIEEKKAITDVCLFVSLVYGLYWNEAPLAAKAPLNDLNLLKQIQVYPNPGIRNAAEKALLRHLWYFSERLVGLAFFDSRIEEATLSKMVQNLQLPSKQKKELKRLDGSTFNAKTPLENFVTQKTRGFFDVVVKDGNEKADSFLAKDPKEWKYDPIYIEMKEKVKLMKVVNDCAERGVALIQSFNSSITKNEEQKQYLLHIVDSHRKLFPSCSKTTLRKE